MTFHKCYYINILIIEMKPSPRIRYSKDILTFSRQHMECLYLVMVVKYVPFIWELFILIIDR